MSTQLNVSTPQRHSRLDDWGVSHVLLKHLTAWFHVSTFHPQGQDAIKDQLNLQLWKRSLIICETTWKQNGSCFPALLTKHTSLRVSRLSPPTPWEYVVICSPASQELRGVAGEKHEQPEGNRTGRGFFLQLRLKQIYKKDSIGNTGNVTGALYYWSISRGTYRIFTVDTSAAAASTWILEPIQRHNAATHIQLQ